jgi:hypothetical protein
MPAIGLKVKYTGAIPGVTMSQREWNAIQRGVWQAVGRYWHVHFRGKHFTRAGAVEYGYQPRSAEYQRRKARQKHHQDPLVFSGESRRRTRTGRIVPFATASRVGVRVRMSAPALSFRRNSQAPDMRDELTTISEGEGQILSRLHRRGTEAGLRAFRGRRTVTIT